MNEFKPLPCPFCGGRAHLVVHEDDGGYRATVYCTSGAEIGCFTKMSHWALKKAWVIKSVTEAWNRRTQPANETPIQRELWPSELPAMNNKCVWVQFSELGMPALVAFHADEDDGDKIYLTNNLGGRSPVEEIIEQGGVIYRRKPEPEGGHRP